MALPNQQQQQQPQTDPRFDLLRKRADQQIGAQGQQAQDALKRRFAAMGNIGSGAYVKQQQLANQAVGEQKNMAMQEINAQEIAEQNRQKDLLQQQQFAAGEAEKQRQFAGSESALQRKMAEEQFGKQFGLSERQFGLSERQFGLQEELGRGQMDIAKGEFDISKQNAGLNRLTAAIDSQDRDLVLSFLDLMDKNGGEIPSIADLNAFHQQRMGHAAASVGYGGQQSVSSEGGGQPGFTVDGINGGSVQLINVPGVGFVASDTNSYGPLKDYLKGSLPRDPVSPKDIAAARLLQLGVYSAAAEKYLGTLGAPDQQYAKQRAIEMQAMLGSKRKQYLGF